MHENTVDLLEQNYHRLTYVDFVLEGLYYLCAYFRNKFLAPYSNSYFANNDNIIWS